jgi:hypothetical protein
VVFIVGYWGQSHLYYLSLDSSPLALFTYGHAKNIYLAPFGRNMLGIWGQRYKRHFLATQRIW